MSVLNDTNVQDGLFYREVASGTSCKNAEKVMEIFEMMDGPRMDQIQYGVSESNMPDGMVGDLNQHWRGEDGSYNWGLPLGSWRQYLRRLREDKYYWQGEMWMPPVRRDVTEERSRDLLAASFFFPFVVRDDKQAPGMQDVFLPVLEYAATQGIKVGSAAVMGMVLDVGRRGVVHAVMSSVSGSRVSLKDNAFAEFNSWSTLLSVGTGTNKNDASAALRRVGMVDYDRASKGEAYLLLAELANICEAAMRSARGRGVSARNMKTHSKRLLVAQLDGDKKLEETLDLMPLASLLGRDLPVSLAYRTSRSKDLSVVASGGVAIVRLNARYYGLTMEDTRAMRFVAVSHSMAHVYSASISMEYAPTEPIVAPTPESDRLRTAMGQVGASTEDMVRTILGDRSMPLKQTVVPLEVVNEGIDALMELYLDILEVALSNAKQDTVGRYLHELFGAYTGKLGGSLQEAANMEQVKEFRDTYLEEGFDPDRDLRRLTEILDKMPMSVVQDFGRMSKIVAPYDVNPLFSYIDRVLKMRVPSPVGNARVVGEFETTVSPHTAAEDGERQYRFKSTGRILMTIADLRSSAAAALSVPVGDDLSSMPWPELLAKLRASGNQVSSAVRVMNAPAFPTPPRVRREARKQAKALIVDGIQPTEVYAGAYLDTENLFKYKEKKDPAISILKPTALPDGEAPIVFSNVCKVERATPTRDTDGRRQPGGGNMITDYLLDKFPTRGEAISFIAKHDAIATTSDKIETNKYPKKTRIITALCGAARRVQGEFESNNGKHLINVPGFMVGVSPGELRKAIYSNLREVQAPGKTRLFGSLDVSSFSAGMSWDVQHWTNEELRHAYDGGGDALEVLEKCTLDAYMVRSAQNIRLFDKNHRGSNFEGVDGKRNTFMHCILWYMARCDAHKAGVEGAMRAYIYIDDGSFSMEVDESRVAWVTKVMREALVKTYVAFGFKLSIMKTVISRSYMQFLNEVYLHGVHIGYGFRALCHTAAQSFPELATASEELSVITGGIRGAATSGGHPLRLVYGMNYILTLHRMGMVGRLGPSLKTGSAFSQAMLYYIPTIAGGYGIPNWTGLFSNLTGNRDVEKLDRVKAIGTLLRVHAPEMWPGVRSYMRASLLKDKTISPSMVADRITIAHPATVSHGDRGRGIGIAKAALGMAVNKEAIKMIKAYVWSGGRPSPCSFSANFIAAVSKTEHPMPIALMEKAMATDPHAAVVTMVRKIAASSMVSRIMPRREMVAYERAYRLAAKGLARAISVALV